MHMLDLPNLFTYLIGNTLLRFTEKHYKYKIMTSSEEYRLT
jgi:hypothetical protein